jgi:glutaminyl-peptide cyclotransferase
MKRYIIIGLIVLVGVAFIIGSWPKGSDDYGLPAEFTFKENLATEWNNAVDIAFEVKKEGVAKVELIYNDSVFITWTSPKGKINFRLNAGHYGLGTRNLHLVSTMTDGSTDSDNRLVKILSDIKHEIWSISISNKGTGDPNHNGSTLLGTIDLNSGEYTKKIGLDANYFGEGITIIGDKIYQLTYTTGKCFIYDKNTLTLVDEKPYKGEGWGLCNDGEFLYMSNGSDAITKRDPKTFEIVSTIHVASKETSMGNINELEFVDGLIYANVWQTNAILVIHPENGKVKAVINATELEAKGQSGGDVQNGIAYNKTNGKFYLTGKYWSKLFEVSVVKPSI